LAAQRSGRRLSAIAIIVEFVFLRRFFKAPRLILTVATIGVTELLAALAFFLTIWFGSPSVSTYPPFFDVHFSIGKLETFDDRRPLAASMLGVMVGLVGLVGLAGLGWRRRVR